MELAACLAVIGLLATAAAVSFGGVRRTHEMQDVVDQLVLIDQLTREHALRFDRTETLLFDLEIGRVQHLDQNSRARADSASAWSLPPNFIFRGVRLQGQGWSTRQVSVKYSAAGVSPTYAIQVSNPATSADAWLIFTGAGGQFQRVANQEVIDAIFEAI